MQKAKLIVSKAALTAVAGLILASHLAEAATVTWIAAVPDTSSASYAVGTVLYGNNAAPGYVNGQNVYSWNTSAANWSGAPTYTIGDNVVFTDNFTGGNIVRVSSSNLNPSSVTFKHISGTTATNYVFLNGSDLLNGTSGVGSNSPWGANHVSTLTLDTGFLGTVYLRARAANITPPGFGNTIIRSGTLELNDGLPLPASGAGAGGNATNTPNIELAGGTLAINAIGNNTQPAGTNLAGIVTVSSNSTLALTRDDTNEFNNATTTVTESRTLSGTLNVASGVTLNLICNPGLPSNAVRMRLGANLTGSTGTFKLTDGTTQTVVRLENALGGPNATFDLGTGTSILDSNLGNATISLGLGEIIGSSTTTLRGSSSSTATSIYAIGGKNTVNTFDGMIIDGTGQALHITKVGTSTLTLTNANTYTGRTTASNGTLVFSGTNGAAASSATLAFATGGTLRLDNTTSNPNRLSDTAVVTMGRGVLEFVGNLAATTSELTGTLQITGGANTVRTIATGSGSAATLTFAGGLARTGGAVDFVLDPSVKVTMTVAPTLNDGMIGGYATANSNDWATLSGSDIAAYSGYTTDSAPGTWAATENINLTTGGTSNVAAATTINSLRMTSGGVSIAAGQSLTVDSGGVLAAGTAGAAISGSGTLTAGSGAAAELFAVVPNASNTLTIGAPIVDNGATGTVSLTKTGAGTMVLSAANTFTGAINIVDGFLKAGAANVLPGTAILKVDNATTFDLGGFNQTFGGVQLINGSIVNSGGAASISVAAGSYDVQNGLISASLGGAGSLSKSASGSVTLSSVNTYTGGTTISNGTLVTSVANALPSGQILTLTGGALDIGATNQSVGAATLTNGSIIGTGGVLTATSFYVDQGTISATLAGSGVALTKGTLGQTVVLTGANTFTGAVTINGGVLSVNALANGGAASPLGASTSDAANLSINNGQLTYTGSGHSTNRLITLAGTTVAVNASGTGAVNFTNASALVGSTTTLTLGGSNLNNNTFAPQITGTTNLVKNNSGVWSVTGNNSYTGTTQITGNGTLVVSSLANGGANSPIGASTSDAANLVLNLGTLKYAGSGSTTNRLFTINANANTIDASGTGPLVFNNTGAIVSAAGVTRTLTLRGSNTGANRIDGALSDPATGSGSLLAITKADAGKWVLNGANTYTSTTTVSAGTLQLGKSAHAPVLTGTTSTGAVVDTALVLDYSGGGTDPSSSVQTILAASYTASSNFTSGVIRSTAASGNRALGWKNDTTSQQVIILNTLDGDANLDGKVNTLDFNQLAGGFGAASQVWANGNFNYDANVDSTDFNMLVGTYGMTVALPGAIAAPALGAVVPEPASLSLLAMGAAGLMRRRR